MPDKEVEISLNNIKNLSREHAILTNFFTTLQIAIDKTSEARGWPAMVFEVRKLLKTTKQLLEG